MADPAELARVQNLLVAAEAEKLAAQQSLAAAQATVAAELAQAQQHLAEARAKQLQAENERLQAQADKMAAERVAATSRGNCEFVRPGPRGYLPMYLSKSFSG